jgi:hypothetical protein
MIGDAAGRVVAVLESVVTTSEGSSGTDEVADDNSFTHTEAAGNAPKQHHLPGAVEMVHASAETTTSN